MTLPSATAAARGVRPAAHAGGVRRDVLVRIPAGTVLLEEVAFRSVLYGLLRNRYGRFCATTLSSSLFGLWHVLPSRELPRLNPAADSRRAIVVPAAVVATAVAGVVLCGVRRHSGSLLAPAALHWAVNAGGFLTAFLAPSSTISTRMGSWPTERRWAPP
ncbi:hypothetical protein GCM10009835_49360 [Planosporangium flavigriseum]